MARSWEAMFTFSVRRCCFSRMESKQDYMLIGVGVVM
jgi:hypothetical protein